MIDGYGREITYLRISVTELCNLRCRYCMPEDDVCKKQSGDTLTEEEIIRAVEAAASLGIRKVRITGGEPLVRKDILSICGKVAAVKNIEEVCLTTNATLLAPIAKQLKQAGVKRINISLDTLDPEKYTHITRHGTLSDALAGVHASLAAGFEKVKINTVLIGGLNDNEIIPLARLTVKYPLDVRFIELMPMQTCGGFGAEAFISSDSVIDRLPGAIPVSYDGVSQLYRLPDAKGNIGLIRTLSHPFCSCCNRIRLTADGKLKPCLHHPDEYSLKGLDSAGMLQQFQNAITQKPSHRGVLSPWSSSRAGRIMNQIGG